MADWPSCRRGLSPEADGGPNLAASWNELGAIELGASLRAERVSSASGQEPALLQSGFTRVKPATVNELICMYVVVQFCGCEP